MVPLSPPATPREVSRRRRARDVCPAR